MVIDAMKSLVSLLASLLMATPLLAAEYVRLNDANPTYTSNPDDVIQILTCRTNGGSPRFVDVDGMSFQMTHNSTTTTTPNPCEGMTVSGVTNWSVSTNGTQFLVVLRVSKPNEGFKSEPVVVPVSQGTSYNVEMETSTDLQTWVPVAPGNYTSTGTPRFFRVKAAVTP